MNRRNLAALALTSLGLGGCGALSFAKQGTLEKIDDKLSVLSDPDGEKARTLERLFDDVANYDYAALKGQVAALCESSTTLATHAGQLVERLGAWAAALPPEAPGRLVQRTEALLENSAALAGTLEAAVEDARTALALVRAELAGLASTRVAAEELLGEARTVAADLHRALSGDSERPHSGILRQLEVLLTATSGAGAEPGLVPELTRVATKTGALLDVLEVSAEKASRWLDAATNDADPVAKVEDKRKWKAALAGFQKLFGDYESSGSAGLVGGLALAFLGALAGLVSIGNAARHRCEVALLSLAHEALPAKVESATWACANKAYGDFLWTYIFATVAWVLTLVFLIGQRAVLSDTSTLVLALVVLAASFLAIWHFQRTEDVHLRGLARALGRELALR